MPATSLSRSDRIRLVQAVRDSLFAESIEQADLILRTFGLDGLNVDSEWQDYNPRSEIRGQVNNADSELLLDIAAHLELEGFGVEERNPSGNFDYLWMPGHIRVFVSHLAEHQSFAGEVVEDLRSLQIDGFVAHTSIEPDHEWQIEIERALDSCEVFVGLLQPGFSESYWTQQEIGWALGRNVPIFMVALGEVPVGFKAKQQASRARNMQPRSAADRIVVSLSKSRQFGDEVTERILASLQNARSFTDARDAAVRLKEMGTLSPKILDGICKAYLDNDQIHPHHVAAPIITRILESHGRQLPEWRNE
jgi:hypothetical protein